LKLYQKAADIEHANAQHNLGNCYKNGLGVEKDLQKAADQGFAMSQYNLGIFYANGHRVEQDDDKAIELLQKAAKQGVEPIHLGERRYIDLEI